VRGWGEAWGGVRGGDREWVTPEMKTKCEISGVGEKYLNTIDKIRKGVLFCFKQYRLLQNES
jgi:hypothetical protein